MSNANYEALILPAAEDMRAVNALIEESLSSQVPIINQLSHYIVHNGGKRLRPIMLILCAKACGYEGAAHREIATILEFIHTATLLHDDVVDESLMRRGQETVNSRWGNDLSVLVGDFLYSRAFELMVSVGDARVMNILAKATNVIAEGEVLQNVNRHRTDISEPEYLDVIESKTATLFGAASQLGALVAERTEDDCGILRQFGRDFGMAYQIVDDLLDYRGDADAIGKNLGDDLAEGQPTLPLIYAMNHADDRDAELIRTAIREGSSERLAEVTAIIESTNAIAYTARLAKTYCDQAEGALADLPRSSFKDALLGLTGFCINRTF